MLESAGRNQEEIKRHNYSLILNNLLQARAICRRDLALRTGLTQGAVSRLSADLIAAGLVCEVGVHTADEGRRGGPNPILLSIAEGGPYVLGLRLQGTTGTVHGGLVNLRGEVIAHDTVQLPPDYDSTAVLRAAAEIVHRIRAERGLEQRSDVLAAGFATAGGIDPRSGIIAWHRSLGLRGINIQDGLEQALGVPVFIDEFTRA
ncbi:MAG: ROK family protein, partial [Chloroflexota bacterium]